MMIVEAVNSFVVMPAKAGIQENYRSGLPLARE
jgi:hypothetical protein